MSVLEAVTAELKIIMGSLGSPISFLMFNFICSIVIILYQSISKCGKEKKSNSYLVIKTILYFNVSLINVQWCGPC